MRTKKQEINFEELLPTDYFSLNTEERKLLCLASIKAMVEVLAMTFGKDITQPDNIKYIIQTTITQYEKNENYETCAILYDIYNLIDEL